MPACGPEQTQPEYQTEEDFTNKHPTGAIPSTPTNFSFAATGFRRLFRWATESTKMRGRTNQAWEVCKQGVEKATVAARLAKKQAHREKLKMIDLKQADYLSGKRAYENQVASETHSAICAQIAEVDHEIDTLRTTPEPMGTSRMEKGKATANAAARLAKANALSLKRTGLLIKLGACLRQDPCDASGFVEIGFAREIAETIRRLNSDIETLASKSFSWAKHALLIVAGIAVFVLASASFQFFPHLSYPTTDAESIKQRSTKSFQVEQPYIPEAFRVVGQLSTYYNYDYGSAERTHFSISLSFPDGESLHGYVPRDSTDGQALYEVLKDGEYHRLILLLRYPHDSKNSGGGSVTEIFRFVQREWRQKDHFPVEDFVRIAHWYGFGYMQGAALRTMKRIVGGSNTASRDDVRDLLISSHVDPKRVSAEEFQSCYDGFVDGHFSRRARFPKQDDPPRNH